MFADEMRRDVDQRFFLLVGTRLAQLRVGRSIDLIFSKEEGKRERLFYISCLGIKILGSSLLDANALLICAESWF